ncbi:MAG TPA: MG2 domain-containing protein [Polyangia bacterium]|nr:MG2 domain-containing protein [Polyangia bacterium]
MKLPRVWTTVLLGALALVFGGDAGAWPVPPAVPPSPWKEVERLASEQKLEAAAAAVEKIRDRARQTNDEPEWTKALVREAQLRMALHGYETAVRSLKDQPWPKGMLSRAALNLFYAHTLVTYSEIYGWEIGQREKIASDDVVDLKAWTQEQIFAAAARATQEVWKVREALGKEPVSKLSGVLEANTYPPEVRGTLRDAVSYLFVELLSNTQGWRPEQSNEIFALDFAPLWKGDPGNAARVKLDDPAVHPLVKVGAILDDLEAWHRGRGARDAELEARLARARTLFASFTDDGDRDALLADLGKRLDGFRNRPWWAMGQATLAGFVEARDSRDNLVRARALADAGAKAYPASPGGQACRTIVARIEAPSYALASMESDALQRRSLLVTHKNFGTLYLRAYPVDLQAHIAASQDYNLLPDGQQMKKRLATTPAAAWTVALPATPDYREHRTYITPPLSKHGFYSIVASVRPDFAEANNRIMGVNFLATGLVVLNQQNSEGDSRIDARVLEGATGRPVQGAEVLLYRFDYRTGHAVVATRKTDGQGLARFAERSGYDHQYFLLAKKGGELAIDASYFSFWRRPSEVDHTNALIYTDRSIYRPLQKILWKAVVFRGRGVDARYRVVADQSVTVILRDGNYQEVDKRTLKTNAYGSVAGDFAVPAGRLLGAWSIATSVGGDVHVRVEEYKRFTFEVKLEDPK